MRTDDGVMRRSGRVYYSDYIPKSGLVVFCGISRCLWDVSYDSYVPSLLPSHHHHLTSYLLACFASLFAVFVWFLTIDLCCSKFNVSILRSFRLMEINSDLWNVVSAWVSANVEGSYKRSVTLAMCIGL